jgi:nucleoid-associated protein YejK
MKPEDAEAQQPAEPMSREEIIRKLNESTEKMMASLQKAYHAGLKEGISEQEEDQLIELLQKTKKLQENIIKINQENPSATGTDPELG